MVAAGKTTARRAGAIAQPWKAGINCIPAIYTREFSSKTHSCNRKDMTRPLWHCFIGIGINCRDLTGQVVPGHSFTGHTVRIRRIKIRNQTLNWSSWVPMLLIDSSICFERAESFSPVWVIVIAPEDMSSIPCWRSFAALLSFAISSRIALFPCSISADALFTSFELSLRIPRDSLICLEPFFCHWC